MKGETLKLSLHQKPVASVLLRLFISSNEWFHITDAPKRISGTPLSNVCIRYHVDFLPTLKFYQTGRRDVFLTFGTLVCVYNCMRVVKLFKRSTTLLHSWIQAYLAYVLRMVGVCVTDMLHVLYVQNILIIVRFT